MYSSRRSSRSPSPSMAKTTNTNRNRSRSRSVSRKPKGNPRHQDENGNMIDDGPVDVLVTAIDTLPSEEWRARTLAFESLIESLPDPSNYNPTSYTPWFKSSPTLRRLHRPISALLLDGRSTVVKHTCQHLAYLVQRVSYLSPQNSDMCKYLLKDLLPTILSLHGQTVNLIRGYTLEMMTVVISACRFKSGLPVLLERLRKDKSRDVREACIRYLRLILRHWTQDSALSFGPDGEPKKQSEGYLTSSICVHIGNGLARALMDPSQVVRVEAKNTFELFRLKYPDTWNHIVQKKDGILSKDARLRKSIMNAAIKADSEGKRGLTDYSSNYDGDDLEASSVKSSDSRESNRSAKSANSWTSMGSFASKNSMRSGYTTGSRRPNMKGAGGTNSSIRSSSRGRSTTGIRGPPVRMQSGNTRASSITRRNGGLTRQDTVKSSNSLSSRNRIPTGQNTPMKSPTRTRTGASAANKETEEEAATKIQALVRGSSSRSVDSESSSKNLADRDENKDSSNITLLDARLQSSTLLKERLQAGSDSSNPDLPQANGANGHAASGSTASSGTGENIIIANQLLAAHKSYIDELMENLRKEMNCVREFESKLTKANSTNSMKGGEDDNGSSNSSAAASITEDAVMEYFEKVYGYLEKATENSDNLRKAIEKVSRAESQ